MGSTKISFNYIMIEIKQPTAPSSEVGRLTDVLAEWQRRVACTASAPASSSAMKSTLYRSSKQSDYNSV